MSKSLPAHWVDPEGALVKTTAQSGWGQAMWSMGEVILASPSGPCDPQRLGWVCAQTRQMVESVGGKGALVFRLGLFLADWVAPLWAFKLPRLRNMDFETRVHVLEKFESSPFGMTLLAVKLFLCIAYFEHPDTADEVGFDGLPLVKD